MDGGGRGASYDAVDSALIGAEVGGYVVEGELGRGGMGVVYAASHPIIGKRAAIKVLRQSLSKSPATVERFLREARSVNQIGHPNIVDIFAYGTLPDGRSYLVMDLLTGEPLRKRIKRSAVPVIEAVPILEEIASALVAAHAKGFIHRDLKPDNVFLCTNPTRLEVKLLDFGLAKLMPSANIERAYRTATGAMIGTPDYMSPEQLRGTGVDHRTDIYAFGVMAFEMLTRSRPHRFPDGTFDLDGLTFKQALVAVDGVPDEMADLIECTIARDPDERATLTAIRAVLKRVRPTLSQPTSGLATTRPVNSDASIESFSPSVLGARPMMLTPPTGTPTTVDEAPPPQPAFYPSSPPPSGRTLSYPPMSSPGLTVPPIPPTPAPVPSTPYGRVSGLRTEGGAAATRLGVAAPQRNQQPHPVAAARTTSESRVWLVAGLVLVVVAAIALVVVLAT